MATYPIHSNPMKNLSFPWARAAANAQSQPLITLIKDASAPVTDLVACGETFQKEA